MDDGVNMTDVGDDGGEDDEVEEFVSMEDSSYYMDPILRLLAVGHSLVAFSMLIAYYCLKVYTVVLFISKGIKSQAIAILDCFMEL